MRKENEKSKKGKCMLLLMGAIVFFTSSFTAACGLRQESNSSNPVQTDGQGVEYRLSDTDEYTVVGAKKGRSELVIPASFLGLPVTEIGKEAFVEHDDLKKITLEHGILRIGEAAFYGCDGLETLYLPNSLQSIGYYAFDECEKLSYFEKDSIYYLGNEQNPFVYLSHSDTDVEIAQIGEGCVIAASYAFKNRNSLTAAVFPEGVHFLGRQIFEDCKKLARVELPKSLEYIDSYAFSRCAALTDLIYSGTKAEWGRVERIWDWRYECVIRKIICSDGEVYL